MQRNEPAERKEGHISDAAAGEFVDESVVSPVREIVAVLYADDLADIASLHDLSGRDVAKANMAYQALPLKLCERGERRFDRTFRGAVSAEHDAQIDHIERLQTEIAKIVLHGLREFFAREGWPP